MQGGGWHQHADRLREQPSNFKFGQRMTHSQKDGMFKFNKKGKLTIKEKADWFSSCINNINKTTTENKDATREAEKEEIMTKIRIKRERDRGKAARMQQHYEGVGGWDRTVQAGGLEEGSRSTSASTWAGWREIWQEYQGHGGGGVADGDSWQDDGG